MLSTMRFVLIGLIGAVMILWGLGYLIAQPETTGEGRFRFSDDLVIAYRAIGAGGALGQTRYEAFAEEAGERQKIFEGSNAASFRISKAGPDLIMLRFCDGIVEHLSSVPATARHGRILIQPILHCPAA